MAIKSDRWIRAMAQKGMIEPFVESQKREGVISYGLSSYGYDMRVGDSFRVALPGTAGVADPKSMDERLWADVTPEGGVLTLASGGVALARSVEYFRIPRKILTITFGKSTYARCGLVVNITPFEPEWEGFVTMEMSNTSPWPIRIYGGEGIAQVLFLESDESCEVSYADRRGKYQNQSVLTMPRI